MRRELICSVMIGASALTGCAEMTHLTRPTRTFQGQAIFIDAKQRAVFSTEEVTCAEPSPDALSALAASNSLSFSSPAGVSGSQGLSVAEAAGSIGLRTQSIQLMRDHMYRLCEGYMSGAISSFNFQLLHRRFQTTMVGILAIEQLTGAVSAAPIVLGGSSAAGDAEALVKLNASRDTAAQAVTAAETALATKRTEDTKAKTDLAAAVAAVTAAGTNAAALATANTNQVAAKTKADAAAAALVEAESLLTQRRATLASVDRLIAQVQSTGNAAASGTFGVQVSRSPEDLTAVAQAVENIVQQTLSLTNSGDFCTLLLADAAQVHTSIDLEGEVYSVCVEKLRSGQAVMPP